MNTEHPTASPSNSEQQGKKPAFEKDPYPKMIIVCIAITILLLLIILGVMFMDFVVKKPTVEGFEPFDTPTDEQSRHEPPRMPGHGAADPLFGAELSLGLQQSGLIV